VTIDDAVVHLVVSTVLPSRSASARVGRIHPEMHWLAVPKDSDSNIRAQQRNE
jgi:hypothetical protein